MQIEKKERKKNTIERDNIFPKNSLGHPNFRLTKKTVFIGVTMALSSFHLYLP